jgi:hypothetical protein
MSPAIKHIFNPVMAVLFLLAACAPAPAPAATQDPGLVQLQEQVETLSAAQTAPATPDPKIDELLQKIDSLVAAQTAQPGQDPAIEELKQQVEALAEQQKALNDALLTPAATATGGATLAPDVTSAATTSQATSSASAPVIEKIDPSEAESYGEIEVTITGQNFNEDEPNQTRFSFGSNEATVVKCESNTICKVILPPATDQASDSTVLVQAINGQTPSQETINFSYLVAPTVISVSPNNGPIAGGTVVTVTGQNFSMEETSKTVFKFDTVDARILECPSTAECRVISPALSGQNQDIVVWVQAVNSSNGAKSQRDTSPETRQAFKYFATPRYACSAYRQAPKHREQLKPGARFRIQWVVQNTGTSAWPAGQDVRFSSGSDMGEVSAMEIGKPLGPNEATTIALDATAPNKRGIYSMTWTVAGQGCSLYVEIQVE